MPHKNFNKKMKLDSVKAFSSISSNYKPTLGLQNSEKS